MSKCKYLLLLAVTGWLASCSADPEPIRFGEDKCAHCQMMISNPNYGGEIVTKKGRVYKFDAVECLINYQEEKKKPLEHKLVIAFDDPKKLYPIDRLSFVISEKYRSPMGANITAFLNPDSSRAPDQVRSWEEVKKHVLK